jgi:ribonuclease P protein component
MGVGPGPEAELKRFGFCKSQRLLTQSDFNRVFKQGKRVSTPEWTLAYRVRPSAPGRCFVPRLGLSVSRKMGGAVQRNLFKRRLREIFRLNQGRLSLGLEIVVIPRKEVGLWDYFELEKRFFSLCERGKVLIKAD